MLDLRFIRENADLVKEAAINKNEKIDIDKLLDLDKKRRSIISENEKLKHEKNVYSEKIAQMKKAGENAEEEIKKMRELSQKISGLDQEGKNLNQEIERFLLAIPNLPHPSVPVGFDESCNVVIRSWGKTPEFDFEPRPHWELGEILGILDLSRASKVAGSGFLMLKGAGAKLERALINFMLDLHINEHGYKEVLPPFMVNRDVMTGTGQLPKFEEDLFKIEGMDYFLIPTAEVPVTNIHRDEIIDEQDLPLFYCAYTPCFRSEAGSYGKETRGIIRQHQFNKVELVKFATPETSYEELERLLLNAEEVLRRLNIHYRVVALCTGDLGFAASKTYDIEVWLPGQEVYKEISSCSNFGDFQARRANIRFRPKSGKGTELVHTLNGSGLAVGRTVVAILENYQQEDGSVVIPEVLRPYMGGVEKIEYQA